MTEKEELEVSKYLIQMYQSELLSSQHSNNVLTQALKSACKQLLKVYDEEGCTYGDECMHPSILKDEVENLAMNYFAKAQKEIEKYGFRVFANDSRRGSNTRKPR